MTEQDDITDMKKCRTGREWMIGLLLGLGIILAGCGSRRSTADDTVAAVTIKGNTYRVQQVDSEIRNENAY